MLAVITGASAGIGRDMARILSHRGAELILVARRGDRLEDLAHELPGHAEIHALDLSREADCYALHELVQKRDVDTLINNAGFGLYGDFVQTDLDTELRLLDTNVRAVHILTKLFLRDFMTREGGGSILNVASIAAYCPGPTMAAYYASKAYVLRLTQAVREEVRYAGAAQRVYVGAFCPGPVRTEFNDVAQVNFRSVGMSSERAARYAVKGMAHRKGVIVPGLPWKLVHACQKLAPSSWSGRMAMYLHQKG